jgi:subtilisin family serine protease
MSIHELKSNRGERDSEDLALLQKVATKDKVAFESLYVRHYQQLSRYLIRLIRRPELVEEVVNDTMVSRVIDAILAKGITIVAAVDSKRSEKSFPASIPGVLAVNSPNGSTLPEIGVVAPGLEILTTTPGATYAFRSGSSMSTAYVSGLAALIKEQNPKISRSEMLKQIYQSAEGPLQSARLVDICRAISREGNELNCDREEITVTKVGL